jgi:hypothetical protein
MTLWGRLAATSESIQHAVRPARARYLDELIILPVGLWLVIRMIPPGILAEHRAAAAGRARPISRAGALIIAALWIIGLAAAAWWLYRRLGPT